MSAADDVVGHHIFQLELIGPVRVEGVFFIKSDGEFSMEFFVGHFSPSLGQQLLKEGPIGLEGASSKPFFGQLQLLIKLNLFRQHGH